MAELNTISRTPMIRSEIDSCMSAFAPGPSA